MMTDEEMDFYSKNHRVKIDGLGWIEKVMEEVNMSHEAINAANILTYAQDEMQDRSKTYDKPEGERSMAATVKAFGAITGVAMTEQQGWQFMEVLKMVRSNQGRYKLDSFIDGAAYAALAGEAAARNNDV